MIKGAKFSSKKKTPTELNSSSNYDRMFLKILKMLLMITKIYKMAGKN